MLITLGTLAVSALQELRNETFLDWKSPYLPLLGTTGFIIISGCMWLRQTRNIPVLSVLNGRQRHQQRRKTLLLKPITLAEISPDKRKRNIVVLGLSDAGKTAFLQRLLRDYKNPGKFSDDPEPTLGVRMTSVDLRGLRQTYYEVGGAETTRVFAKEFLHMANLVIFVVDATAEDATMESARAYFSFVFKDAEYDGPIVVIANKQDLPNPRSVRELYQALGINDKDDVYILPACSAPKYYSEKDDGDRIYLLDNNTKQTMQTTDQHYGIIENLLYRTFTE
ncbi:ADP-ribosylation factor J-like [Paramacrobiotus metropolitanus]|uniref:ADP-ribosylation factor J-like n=1 Tax=Paramacrobiotus metropolitanus TaxID=2943436 RepID=UPI002445AC95|nr:ADP-ribosylation factor J-like [Paramacrobiotus metropolitanus]